MKVLFMEWNSFGNPDMIEAFHALGHTVLQFQITNESPRRSPKLEEQLSMQIRQDQPDIVFSFNYFPFVSLVCNKAGIPYLSWVYDSPYVLLYSYTVINPCNLIFLFDKELFYEFHQAGIQTVYYLPLAANPKRLSSMIDACASSAAYETDISFVGALYTEKHQFYERMDFSRLSAHTIGYLEGIMAAQQKVHGYNFIQECLTPAVLAELKQALPMEPNPDGVESLEFLYAQYMLNRKITSLERTDLLCRIAKKHPLDLYTQDRSFSRENIQNHGPVDYYDEMPLVFHGSKINLNISLRSIKSGIPLRCFDIMASRGFLLTNYQADFLDFFEPGDDFAFYDSEKDLMSKIEYYLHHADERSSMTANAFQKILDHHTYEHRIQEMLSYLHT